MDTQKLHRLLRRTGRKLFFARWLTSTLSFYFYAFFLGTALVLTDRIGGEADFWTPFTLEWVILTGVVIILVTGVAYGLMHAWWSRRSNRELAWMIDRRSGANAVLVTALEAEETSMDPSWFSLVEREANNMTKRILTRNLFRLPGQGIRWMFLLALLIDLGLVLFLTPVRTVQHGVSGTKQETKSVAETPGENGGEANENKEAARSTSASGDREEEERDKQDERSTDSQSSGGGSSQEDPPFFGEEQRKEHQRESKGVRIEAEEGPTREGFVRMVKRNEEHIEKKPDSSKQDHGDEQSGDPSRADTLHRQFQRRAERMIWGRSLSSDERDVVRRYFREIRPRAEDGEETRSGGRTDEEEVEAPETK